VLSGYADRLGAAGGRLYLSGVDPQLAEFIRRFRPAGGVDDHMVVYEATPVIGESSTLAYKDAQAWLEGEKAPRNDDG
jgi:SulP family sulfate permease